MRTDDCLRGNVCENRLLRFDEGFRENEVPCTKEMISLGSRIQCLFISLVQASGKSDFSF